MVLLGGLASAAERHVPVSFLQGYDPDRPEEGGSRLIIALSAEEPRLEPRKWGGLSLPGGGGRAPFMLSIAGDTAPDIYLCWFHIMRHDIEQSFLAPLNEWLGDDVDGDGQLSDAEAKWSGWKDVPPLWRTVATEKGKVYGVPQAGIWYYGIVYRKDLVAQAGLDPEEIPATWSEFLQWCRRLTFPHKNVPGAKIARGQRAFGAENRPWAWLPWVQSAGGDVIVQSNGLWRASFDSAEAVAAAEFFQQMAWAPWVRDPETGEPVELSDEEVKAGEKRRGGRTIRFKPEDVIEGVVRALPRLTEDVPRLFAQGEIVSFFAGAETAERLARDANLPPEMIGIMPFPARTPLLKPVLQAHKHYYGMTARAGRRPKEERDLIWRCIERLASREANDVDVRRKVLEGNARWCNPRDLQRLGLEEYLEEVPRSIRQMYARLDAGEIRACTEPYAGFWQAVSDLVDRRLLGLLLSDAGKSLDCAAALKSINDDANRGLMFKMPEEELAKARPVARAIVGILAVCALVCLGLALTSRRAHH